MAITQNEFNVLMAQWLIDNGGQYSSAHTGAVIDAAVTAVKAKEASWDAKIGAFSVGTTVTGVPGTSASVTNSGTASEPILDFVIPKGQDGETGQDGFSPTIAEDESNSATSYKLNISNKDGQFTTPNLRAVSFVENAQVYSQEEQVIGTWIDGKPLYRKIITGSCPSVANQNIAVAEYSYLNVEQITSYYGMSFDGAGTAMGLDFSSGDPYKLLTYVSTTDIKQYAGSSLVSETFRITIEYTKTTDEATVAVATAEELNTAYDEGVQGA